VPRTGDLQVDDLAVEVTVRRVKRMNVRVHPPDGSVRLSVPPRTSERTIVRFVRESRAWIDEHRRRIADEQRRAATRPVAPVLQGRTGESWQRFGRGLLLEVERSTTRPTVMVLSDERLVVRVTDPDDGPAVLAALDRWQRRDLRAVAEPLLTAWCTRLGVRHEFLGLRRMTTRWGTCVPARRRIWLNVALVTRPLELIEYVVVHEAVHLRETSHGPAFQALMDAHLPDWRTRRTVLDASV
jgi:predicted metal-dependent hydrolase